MPLIPHHALPRTPAQVLLTGTIDPSFAALLKETPVPTGKDWTIAALKSLVQHGLKRTQDKLVASRPLHITESENFIPTRDGWEARTVVCAPTAPNEGKASPLIVLYFGGGHCVGFPETELAFARLLVEAYNAVVVLPDYRLAPEFKFPCSVLDSWDTLRYIAAQALDPGSSSLLPDFVDVSTGFVVGGTSAGANITGVLTHLARDEKLRPAVTGQALFAGAFVDPGNVPDRFKEVYLAKEQNKHAPIIDVDMLNLFHAAHRPDKASPLWGSFDQRHAEDEEGEVRMGHIGLPPTYFQVCGMDMSRDDSLLLERVLREECGVQTRVDAYWGWPHCWWNMWPEAQMSKIREREAIEGVGWLLKVGREGKGEEGTANVNMWASRGDVEIKGEVTVA